MTEPADALARFQSFVASISYSEDHFALAAQLGQAKSYWADAALALSCVRACASQGPKLTAPARANAQSQLQRLGLIHKTVIERRS